MRGMPGGEPFNGQVQLLDSICNAAFQSPMASLIGHARPADFRGSRPSRFPGVGPMTRVLIQEDLMICRSMIVRTWVIGPTPDF